jgi:hypothetical protein
MFEPVLIPPAIHLVAHNLGHPQHAEHGADPLHAPAERAGDCADAQLFVLRQQLNDGEGQRIPEQATEPRLSVAPFLHAGLCITFPEFRKREM